MQHKPRPPKRPSKPGPSLDSQAGPDRGEEAELLSFYRGNPSRPKPGALLKRLLRGVGLPSKLEEGAWTFLRSLDVTLVDDRGHAAVAKGDEDYARDALDAATEWAQELVCAGVLPIVQRNPLDLETTKAAPSEEGEDEDEEYCDHDDE